MLGAFALCGCSSTDALFQLSDVERLSVGESTREEVERHLGKPSAWSAYSGVHQTGSFTAVPGPPFSFIVWPIYRGGRIERCTVNVWYDSQNILSEGTIRLDSNSFTEIVMALRVHGVDYLIDEGLLEPLRRVELKGFKIQVAEGDRHKSLKRFLEERNSTR